ncbi:MAG: hypothetical protein GY841_14145 [FCB group bacterium]|nr:hypothetical protein [FCB group bacterium]
MPNREKLYQAMDIIDELWEIVVTQIEHKKLPDRLFEETKGFIPRIEVSKYLLLPYNDPELTEFKKGFLINRRYIYITYKIHILCNHQSIYILDEKLDPRLFHVINKLG